MNQVPSYINLINRFWQIQMEVGLSHLEVHLFFKLLEINNRLDWKQSFQYANSRLEGEIGTRQKNLITARDRLCEHGIISYQKGTTRNAGIYSLLPLILSSVVTKESNQESNQGNINKTRKEKTRKDISPNGDCENPSDLSPPNAKLNFKEIIISFHDTCKSFPKVQKLTDPRKDKIKTRIYEIRKLFPDVDYQSILRQLFEKTEESDFLRGNNKNGWKASFDWIFENGKNWVKIYEGNYDNNKTNAVSIPRPDFSKMFTEKKEPYKPEKW